MIPSLPPLGVLPEFDPNAWPQEGEEWNQSLPEEWTWGGTAGLDQTIAPTNQVIHHAPCAASLAPDGPCQAQSVCALACLF